MKKEEITLKDGTKCEGDSFDDDDYKKLLRIFGEWLSINRELKEIGGRSVNVPDVLSEALFCVHFNAVRTNGTASSYDCVSRDDGNGIQVKSCSIRGDCTSFGPETKWDELYFMDFAPHGKVDGCVDFYKIDEDIGDIIVNSRKGETFHDQQLQGRRPRFSIKKCIIEQYKLKPIKSIDLNKEIDKYGTDEMDENDL